MPTRSFASLLAEVAGSISIQSVAELSSAYLGHLKKFSSDPDWSGYGYYHGEPPSALDVELERPINEVLDDYDPEVDLEDHLAALVGRGDQSVNAVYGRIGDAADAERAAA